MGGPRSACCYTTGADLTGVSPLVNYVDTKITWGTKLYTMVYYDVIGRWSKKIANNK